MISLMAIGSHDGALKEGLPSVSGQLGLISRHGHHDRGPERRHLSVFFSWGRMRTQLLASFSIRAHCLISSVLGKTTGAWPDFREREKEGGRGDRDNQ